MNDLQGIEQAIANYFEGVRASDLTTIKKAFLDSNVHMKGIMTIDGKPELLVWSDEEALKTLAENGSKSLKGHIKDINIYADNAAFAVFNFNDVYTDAFQLLKIDGEWKIINKTFVEQ